MSLTHTAYTSRLIIKYGGIGVVAFAILWSVTTAGIRAYKAAHPPYQAPTVRYGLLPKVIFPEKEFERKSFVQEMPNDSLPNFSDQAKVYVVYRPQSRFMALEEDVKTAKSLGFDGDPVEINPGLYRFKNDNLNKILTMNVLDGSFELEYPYMSDQMLLKPSRMFGESDAISSATNFLRSGGKISDDIAEGEKQVTFLKIEMGSVKEVSSISEANLIRVDFYRSEVENKPILSANHNSANISVLVSGSDVAGKKIVGTSYKYAPVDKESYSTYPIKTSKQAWEELKGGNYWPAKDVSGKSVTIRRMYLAYFEPVTLTNYMQPIYVFEGDGGFIAYVTAVTDNYIQDN